MLAFFKLIEKHTAATHLSRTLAWVEVGHGSALMWGSDGDQLIAAFGASKILQVVATDQAAHAVANDGECFRHAESLIDLVTQICGEGTDASATIGWTEFRSQAADIAFLEPSAQVAVTIACLEKTVDENDIHGRCADFGGFMKWIGLLDIHLIGVFARMKNHTCGGEHDNPLHDQPGGHSRGRPPRRWM